MPLVDTTGAVRGSIAASSVRGQPAETRLATLAQQPDTILSDAPLSRAVVRMKEGRRLVVLDPQTGSRVVGMLTIADLVRAHAGLAGNASIPRVPTLPTGGLDGLTAGDISERAPIVTTDTNLKGVLSALVRSPSNAVLVRGADGQLGVVLLEHVRDFLDDEQLHPVLAAADLMRPTPAVSGQASFAALVTACLESEAVVLPAPDNATEGEIVTRTALGVFLLKWYSGSMA